MGIDYVKVLKRSMDNREYMLMLRRRATACIYGILELIVQAFCRPPFSTLKWIASRQTRFLHARLRVEAARVTTCKRGGEQHAERK